jgi:microcystin degradation protein MlrC
MARIAVGGFQHETNCFVKDRTDFAYLASHRDRPPLVRGQEVIALLTVGGVSVAVTSKRMQALDQAPFRHLGVEPKDRKILALKSTCHFRAEFEPIAEKVIVVIAPGGYLADPGQYPYQRLRPGVRLRPLGPAFVGAGAG